MIRILVLVGAIAAALAGCGPQGSSDETSSSGEPISTGVASDDKSANPTTPAVSLSIAGSPSGTLAAWGANTSGMLGDGTTTTRYTPTSVPGVANVVAIAAGGSHTVALLSNGTLRSWGQNGYGQLGDGTTIDPITPVTVVTAPGGPPLDHMVAVAAGFDFTAALESNGTVWTWGRNNNYQLGNGTQIGSAVPKPVNGLSNVIAIATSRGPSYYSLALDVGGVVWAWGGIQTPGGGNSTPVPAPAIPMTPGVTAIAAGMGHGMLLMNDGTIRAWGSNGNGQLGNGTNVSSSVPVAVLTSPGGPSFSGVTSIAAGVLHSLALRSDGTVWAWGTNIDGELGNGQVDGYAGGFNSVHPSPSKVLGLANVIQIRGGYLYSAAVLSDGTVRTWGRGYSGELGNGTSGISPTPIAPIGLGGVFALSVGWSHVMAIRSN